MSPSFKHLVSRSRDSAYSTAAVRSSWDPTQTPAASLRALSPRHATQEEVFYQFYPSQSQTRALYFAIFGTLWHTGMPWYRKWCRCPAFSSLTSTACFNNLSPLALFPKKRHDLIAHEESRTIMGSFPRQMWNPHLSDQWSIHDPLDPDMQVSYKCHQIISSLDSTNCLALRLPRPKWQTTGHLRTCLQALQRSVTVDSLVWFTV